MTLLLAVCTVTLAVAPAAARPYIGRPLVSADPNPTLELIKAQQDITVQQQPQGVFIDPGIWLASLGSPLQLNVSRVNYKTPAEITQVVSQLGHRSATRRLPASVLDGWHGLKDFTRLTVRTLKGKVVYSTTITMCPDSYSAARVSPDSPATSPYPQYCDTADPFVLGNVWAIQKGWAIDPAQPYIPLASLSVGTYRVTESITSEYVKLFHIAPSHATATVTMTVEKASAPAIRPTLEKPRQPSTPSSTPILKNPPSSALPDLAPLPSWGISITSQSGRDLLMFGATVWVGGNGPLDVEGFRQDASPTMPAWQYFWRGGKQIGRVRAGTMGFDSQHGHNHWHFEQFAAYRLLTGKSKLISRSQKVGFCITPTDEVNLTLPAATWQSSSVGLQGACGSSTALWVQEHMPVGWGDTYFQSVAGQAFDVTDLPNGTYYIEIIANPDHVLRELNLSNDTSLRKVILSGSRGHRAVSVPAVNGIDSELA
jgi:hypothetical protein